MGYILTWEYSVEHISIKAIGGRVRAWASHAAFSSVMGRSNVLELGLFFT